MHHQELLGGVDLQTSLEGALTRNAAGRDRKMELPVFVGEDALGWLVKDERYFAVNEVEGDERMEVVLLSLEGKALNWIQTSEDQVAFPSRRQFKKSC